MVKVPEKYAEGNSLTTEVFTEPVVEKEKTRVTYILGGVVAVLTFISMSLFFARHDFMQKNRPPVPEIRISEAATYTEIPTAPDVATEPAIRKE